ncbi:MAG: VanZ family protein [Acidimicrobiia bacterium]|nr:VanZ family protein [Acidimicrobiia bacterium]
MAGSTDKSTFSTERERCLWLLTGAVVVAIYSTLGLATTMAEELTNRDMLDNISALALLALFAVVALVGLKGRAPSVFRAAIAVGVVAVYALVFLRMASPIERSHLFEYSLVAILIHEALLERVRAGRHVTRPALLAIGAAASIGVVDELIQLVLPSRVFDPIDLGFNAFAAFMGVAVSSAVAWAVRPKGQR